MKKHNSARFYPTNAGEAQGRALIAGLDLDPPSQTAENGPLIPLVRTVFVRNTRILEI